MLKLIFLQENNSRTTNEPKDEDHLQKKNPVVFRLLLLLVQNKHNNGKGFFNKPSLSQQLMSFSWDKNFFLETPPAVVWNKLWGGRKTSFQTLFLFRLLLLLERVVGVDSSNFENKKESFFHLLDICQCNVELRNFSFSSRLCHHHHHYYLPTLLYMQTSSSIFSSWRLSEISCSLPFITLTPGCFTTASTIAFLMIVWVHFLTWLYTK